MELSMKGFDPKTQIKRLGMVLSGCKVRVREETGKALKLAGQSD